MMRNIFFVFFLLYNIHAYAQNNKIPIVYDDEDKIGIYIDKFSVRLNDTIVYKKSIKSKPHYTYKVYLSNLKGEAKVWVFQKNSLVCAGQFIESIDTLKRYVIVSKPPDAIGCLEVQEYYSPIKNGKWTFYKNNKPIYIELWRCGLLRAVFKGKDMDKCPNE